MTTKIRIDAKDFISFLEKVNLGGLVYDCVITVKGGNLTACGLDVSRAVYFRISGEAKVEKAGEVCVGNIKKFMDILARFDGVVSINATEKQIEIRQRGKVGRFQAALKKSIDSFAKADMIKLSKDGVKTPYLNLKYKTNCFSVASDQLKEIVADADVLDEHVYYFIVKGGKVLLKVEQEKNSFTTKLDIHKSKLRKDMTSVFGHGVKEVFKSVTGRVKMYLEKKPPLMMKFVDGIYLVMTREK